MLRRLCTLLLRMAGALAVTVLAALLAGCFGAGDGRIAVPVLSLFGGLAFFLAPHLDGVIWQTWGLRASASPAAAFRILGVTLWVVAGLCLLLWRN
jgi:hypothetical protein